MSCDDVMAALSNFAVCEETPEGSRIVTHCVYPSFDPVSVYVTKYGDGFHVHDGGGAARSAWVHGRDDKAYQKIMERYAKRFGISFEHDCYKSVVHGKDWLTSAILAVANTSALAANEAVEFIAAATEKALKARIDEILTEMVPAQNVGRQFEIRGKSGKVHEFDFVIQRPSSVTLLDAVAPHHVSISSKYVAFADTEMEEKTNKYAVYDRDLDISDSALLQQVADLVPFSSLRLLMTRVPHNGR
jgi:hypothetical protein